MEEYQKIKVLQIPSWYPPEGGEFCSEQAVLLKKAGIDIEVLAHVVLPARKYKWKIFSFLFKKPFYSTENGVKVFRAYYLKIPRSEKLNMKRWTEKTFHLFEQYLKENGKPDIIHIHCFKWAGLVGYLIKEKYDIPYVITEHHGMFGHESDYTRKSLKEWYIQYLEKIFSRANYILPVGSPQIKKISSFSSPRIPIRVVSNVIDTNIFTYKERKKKSVGKSFTFFAANSYSHYKAYDILLKAFDLVCMENEDVNLRIAGSHFDEKDFQQLLSLCSYKNKIYFCGYLSSEEIYRELNQADALVLPSRAESQSITVLEALSTGLPVVCTEVVPIEVAGDNDAYRVPVEDPDALAKAMLKMVENRHLFDEKEISRRAQTMASPEAFIKITKEIYQQVLKNHG